MDGGATRKRNGFLRLKKKGGLRVGGMGENVRGSIDESRLPKKPFIMSFHRPAVHLFHARTYTHAHAHTRNGPFVMTSSNSNWGIYGVTPTNPNKVTEKNSASLPFSFPLKITRPLTSAALKTLSDSTRLRGSMCKVLHALCVTVECATIIVCSRQIFLLSVH